MSEQQPPLQKRAWDTLSTINVNDKVEKKNDLSYLSWAWAWGVLMEYYPESSYTLHQDKVMNDGSVMVGITLTIKDKNESFSRDMWLPVMNFKNMAIINPNAVEINKSYMRCLAKAVAMCGLGHYIYAGDDLPQEDDSIAHPKPTSSTNSKPASQKNTSSGQANNAKAKEYADKLIKALDEAESLEKLNEIWEFAKEKMQGYSALLANLQDLYEARKTEFE